MGNPSVSVVILNYRRRADLLRAIQSCRRQNYSPLEIVVVDNHSEDGTVEHLATEYPEIRTISMRDNSGCAGRNSGVQAAKGEIVITIDNDVFFDSDFEVSKAVRSLEKSAANCIVFQVLRADTGRLHVRDWCHPRDYTKFANSSFETCFIAEGASAFYRSDFLSVGGYWPELWIGCEGWDLALRMLDAGMSIVYAPEVRVLHAMSPETRGDGRNYYFYTRNYIWIGRRDYPGWRKFTYVAYHLAMLLWFTLRTGNLDKLLKGLRDGFLRCPVLKPAPISLVTFHRLSRIMSSRPGIITRVRRHWAKPLI